MKVEAAAPLRVIPASSVAAEMKPNISAEAGTLGRALSPGPCLHVYCFRLCFVFFHFSHLNYTLIDMFNTCAVKSRCGRHWVGAGGMGDLLLNEVSSTGVRFYAVCFTN